MRIYSKGISEERIDFIAERKLKGYISPRGKYAIVTVEDDKRETEQLCEYLEIENPMDDFYKIVFSPAKIVSGLKYLLVPDAEREDYYALIDEFRKSFYKYVFDYYMAGKLITRAEAVRIVWGAFNRGKDEPLEGVDKNELDNLLKSVSVSEDEAWICDKFFELIIKYAVHILMWEKRYVYNKAYDYLLKREGEERKEEQIDDYDLDLRTVQREFVFLFEGEGNQKYKKDNDFIRKCFSKEEIKSATHQIQKDIYSILNIELTESIEAFCDFFEQSQKAESGRKRKVGGPVSMYGFLLFVNYFYYKRHKDDKKEQMEFLIDVSNHIGDITDMVVDVVSAATEIVLMLMLAINDCPDENIKDDIFAKKATVIQIDILTLVENMLPKTEDRFDVNSTVEEIKKALCDDVRIGHLRGLAGERINKLKDKDKANIIGSVYMYASSYENGIKGLVCTDVQMRAREKARSYWMKRKKCFNKKDKEMFKRVDISTVTKMFQYLKEQNMVYRNNIRGVLETFISSL